MPDDTSQGGTGFLGTLKAKFGPLPVWGWLALVTVVLLGYWLYEQHKNAGATGATANGPGAVGQPGVVVINQDEPVPPSPPVPAPPPKKKPPEPPEGSTRKITVEQNETLGQLARQRHWSQETLQDVEAANVTQGQGQWTADTKLTKGETVIRPIGG